MCCHQHQGRHPPLWPSHRTTLSALPDGIHQSAWSSRWQKGVLISHRATSTCIAAVNVAGGQDSQRAQCVRPQQHQCRLAVWAFAECCTWASTVDPCMQQTGQSARMNQCEGYGVHVGFDISTNARDGGFLRRIDRLRLHRLWPKGRPSAAYGLQAEGEQSGQEGALGARRSACPKLGQKRHRLKVIRRGKRPKGCSSGS